MFQNVDLKLIFSVVASVLIVVAYYPYIRDIFLKKTRPHIYTWLIWFITTGTATAGAWRGGGGSSIFSLCVSLILVMAIVLLSVKYGTKNIAKSDTIVLFLALGSIAVWWGLDNPVLAVGMAAMIDGLGYIPTYRKSWKNPDEETFSFWVTMVMIYGFMFLSMSQYNWLTVPYVATVFILNIILVAILFFRRKMISKNN